MLQAMRNEPSPRWLHPFQALDSLSSLIPAAHILVYNVSSPMLPALLSLYSPASLLSVTPFPISMQHQLRSVQTTTLDSFASQPSFHHHSVGLLPSAFTSSHSQRRRRDLLAMHAMERSMRAEAVVLLLQPLTAVTGDGREGGLDSWWDGPLIPTGWTVEAWWGWEREEAEGRRWRLAERWRQQRVQDVMTVWLLRVRADVGPDGEQAEPELAEGQSPALTAWEKATEQLRPNVTWLPYSRVNRL